MVDHDDFWDWLEDDDDEISRHGSVNHNEYFTGQADALIDVRRTMITKRDDLINKECA